MSEQERTFKPSARRRARRFVLQGLYEHLLTGHPPLEIESRCRASNDLRKTDVEYMHELFAGCTRECDALVTTLATCLDRPWKQLTPVERAVLLIGCYELLHRPDIPYPVVVNEAVELSVHFGTSEGHRYVNGVMDRLAHQLRIDECAQSPR